MQASLTHAAVAFGAVGQAWQVAPQESTESFDAQARPQAWVPGAQSTPQLPAAQVATPFGGTGHGTPLGPQLVGVLSEAQLPLTRW